jgi:hypothetical protein
MRWKQEVITAYSINKSSQEQAQRSDVAGFGNNGGEELWVS